MKSYDLIVIGAGSGGAGAALTAGRLGLRTLWVERESRLGGTGVHSLVNVWQPSYGTSELAPEIAGRLIDAGQGHYAAGACDTPTGRPLYRADSTVSYEQTLVRWQDQAAGITSPLFVYEPAGMDCVLREMALETGRVELASSTTFIEPHTSPAGDGLTRIDSVTLQSAESLREVTGGQYVDATANIAMARSAGCGWAIGAEAAQEYAEPSAPAERQFRLNGWTLCFSVRPGADRVVLPERHAGPEGDWAHIGALPQGGYYVNLCFQLTGEAGWRMGPELAREYLLANIAKRWPSVRSAYGLDGYGLSDIAPRVGVREGPRLVARYVLNENDYRRGKHGQHPDDCIAFTDHALDSHSPGGGCMEAPNGPVGIPLRCLQTQEVSNLMVACRGAGFSSLAASAVRLQRTMVELGEAAARAIAAGIQ